MNTSCTSPAHLKMAAIMPIVLVPEQRHAGVEELSLLKGNEMSELRTPSYYVTILSDPLNGKVTQAQGCLKV